jgi:hypothetical protein
MKKENYLFLLPIPYSLLPIPPASAHKVKITEDVGATLHIEPNDNPRAGEPAQAWFALTRKGGKTIALSECNCQLLVFSEPRKPDELAILKPTLKSIIAERYQGIPGADITFPKPGAYQLQLIGKSTNAESFKPFEFKFEVTVAAGSSQPLPSVPNSAKVEWQSQETATNSHSTPFLAFFGIALLGVVVLVLIFAKSRGKRNL